MTTKKNRHDATALVNLMVMSRPDGEGTASRWGFLGSFDDHDVAHAAAVEHAKMYGPRKKYRIEFRVESDLEPVPMPEHTVGPFPTAT